MAEEVRPDTTGATTKSSKGKVKVANSNWEDVPFFPVPITPLSSRPKFAQSPSPFFPENLCLSSFTLAVAISPLSAYQLVLNSHEPASPFAPNSVATRFSAPKIYSVGPCGIVCTTFKYLLTSCARVSTGMEVQARVAQRSNFCAQPPHKRQSPAPMCSILSCITPLAHHCSHQLVGALNTAAIMP
jgi:hypothetical protein